MPVWCRNTYIDLDRNDHIVHHIIADWPNRLASGGKLKTSVKLQLLLRFRQDLLFSHPAEVKVTYYYSNPLTNEIYGKCSFEMPFFTRV